MFGSIDYTPINQNYFFEDESNQSAPEENSTSDEDEEVDGFEVLEEECELCLSSEQMGDDQESDRSDQFETGMDEIRNIRGNKARILKLQNILRLSLHKKIKFSRGIRKADERLKSKKSYIPHLYRSLNTSFNFEAGSGMVGKFNYLARGHAGACKGLQSTFIKLSVEFKPRPKLFNQLVNVQGESSMRLIPFFRCIS